MIKEQGFLFRHKLIKIEIKALFKGLKMLLLTAENRSILAGETFQ